MDVLPFRLLQLKRLQFRILRLLLLDLHDRGREWTSLDWRLINQQMHKCLLGQCQWMYRHLEDRMIALVKLVSHLELNHFLWVETCGALVHLVFD